MSGSPAGDPPLIRAGSQGRSADLLDDIVGAVREHLAMGVSFLVELDACREVVRRLTGDGARLASLQSLAPGEPEASVTGGPPGRFTVTARFGSGAPNPLPGAGPRIGVAVRDAEGRHYGTLWCVSHDPGVALGDRDRGFARVLADLIARELSREEEGVDRLRARIDRLRRALTGGDMGMAFQPILHLASGSVAGVEALARFAAEPHTEPQAWFGEAWDLGLGLDLELAAVRAALAELDRLPPGAYLSVNVSPDTLLSEGFQAALDATAADRLVVELTEHAAVREYGALTKAIGCLRARGVRLAVDDMGAGYAGLTHLLRLRPDITKLDTFLVRGIDTDPARQALVAATVSFARQTDSAVIAEGTETPGELATLRSLGVDYGQGFHLGRPGPLPVRTPFRA